MSHKKRGADADEEPVEEPTKLDVGADNEQSATFAFENEDHTLGNSLRYMLMKSPHVAFCGYSVPHPSEPKMNLRLQTNGAPVTAVFRQGLTDLNSVCEHVLDTFEAEVARFEKEGVVAMDE